MQNNYFSNYSRLNNLQSSMLIINQNREILHSFGNFDNLITDEIMYSTEHSKKMTFTKHFENLLSKAIINKKSVLLYKPSLNENYNISICPENGNATFALVFNKTEVYPSISIENEFKSTGCNSVDHKPLYIHLTWLYKNDNKCEIIHCDSKVSDFLNLKHQDAIEYLSNLNIHLFEEDKDSFIQCLNKSFAELTDFIYEGRIWIPNKKLKWIQCCFSPIDLGSNVLKYSGVIIDVTEKKQIENNLHETNARLKTLLAHFTSGIILTNDKSKPIFVNPGFLKLFDFKFTLYDFIHNSPSLLRRTAEKIKDKRQFISKISLITRSRNPSINHQFEFIDGRFIAFDYVPITHNEQWLGHLWIFRDITDQIAHEKELLLAKEIAENSEKTKSAFLASMSHELRTPLNGILGCSDAILDVSEEGSVKRLAHIIEISGRRLLDSLNSILDLSALQAGKVIISKSLFSINELIEDHVSLFREKAIKQKLTLTFEDEGEISIYNDSKLLNKILDNLTNNAIKFTHKGGITIHLSTEKINNQIWAKIDVADTGIGIKKENQKLVFEAFRQVSEGYRREFDGTGLGLNLTQQYLNLMGGSISLTSTFGEGSIFTLLLPGVEQNTPLSIIKEKQLIYKKNSYLNKKAFVVENDSTNISVLEFQLENYIQAEFAKNGKKAIEMLSKNKYDIVLLDIHLGKSESGIDVLNYMRSNNLNKNTPAIAITAHALPNDQKILLSKGFDAYLSKPYTKETLFNIIAKHLV